MNLLYEEKSTLRKSRELILNLLDSLLADKILGRQKYHSLKENFCSNEETFKSLFLDIGEEKIKSYIEQNFGIKFEKKIQYTKAIGELADKNIMNNLLKNCIIPINITNDELHIIVDYPNDKLEQILKDHYSVKSIKYSFALKQNITIYLSWHYDDDLCLFSTQNINFKSANSLRPDKSRLVCLVIFLCLICFIISIFNIKVSVSIICLVNIIYFIQFSFKFLLSIIKNDCFNINTKTNYSNTVRMPHLPTYTIFLPILSETKYILIQLISSVMNFNYPLHKLDIHILVESNDCQTIEILQALNLKYIFNIIYIPQYGPRTKAKSCNYALKFSSGYFLTIYDADDIPDRDQLRTVIKEFENDKNLHCVQCTLNSYNHNDNLLSKSFSTEFTLWYKVFLPSLHKLKMPITFGGTSNHFKCSTLQENPYDAFNVTEDADLGIRWWRQNLKTKLINSMTLEESPLTLKAWINQRSRWIKGFIQTYFVHCRVPHFKFQLWLNIFVMMPILSQGLFLIVVCEFFILRLNNYNNKVLVAACIINLSLNYGFQIMSIIFNKDKLNYKLDYRIALFPIYSMLNIVATYKAINQFFKKQYYWEKTSHGFKQKF